MWVETLTNSKGTRYKYCERYELPNGDTRKVSITLNSNSTYARKQASIELQNKIKDIIKELHLDPNITMYEVAQLWLEHTEPTVKISTHINHSLHVKKIFTYIDTGIPLVKVTPIMIENMVHSVYYKENLSYYYAKSILTTVRAIFRHAKRRRIIQDIHEIEDINVKKKPFTHTEIAKKQNKFLDAVELKSVLAQLTKLAPRIALLIEFMSLTGLRIGELLALRYCDYDTKKATINVNGTLQYFYKNGSDIKRGTPKNIYSIRDIALDNRCVKILNTIITDNKRQSLWFKGYNEQGYIFTAKRGSPYDMQYINKLLKQVHIKGKHLTTHIFRHTHISMLAELGIPLKAIMQRVGHNDPATTLSIYTHVTQHMKDDIVEKLNSRNR
ncbi:site-specific integrase [uncultured Veillonella sp.]|uniref:tyrosine-type recombinase/integrase n=1 Tax=uncultured Veillonella sp. TaxID=159268 RepID=UPI00266D2DCD|nr:site-specific integrase [uncultured Veillonella sp.]